MDKNGQNYLAKSNIVEFVLKRPTSGQWCLLLIDHRIKDFQPFVQAQVGIPSTSKATHFDYTKVFVFFFLQKESHFYYSTVIITQLILKLILASFSSNLTGNFFTFSNGNWAVMMAFKDLKGRILGLKYFFLAANKTVTFFL